MSSVAAEHDFGSAVRIDETAFFVLFPLKTHTRDAETGCTTRRRPFRTEENADFCETAHVTWGSAVEDGSTASRRPFRVKQRSHLPRF